MPILLQTASPTDDFLLLPIVYKPCPHSILCLFRKVHRLHISQGSVHPLIVHCLYQVSCINYVSYLKNFSQLLTLISPMGFPSLSIESIFIFRDIKSNFSFLFHFSMKIILATRICLDRTPRFAASHLGLFYLPMSHEKDARLIWVKRVPESYD